MNDNDKKIMLDNIEDRHGEMLDITKLLEAAEQSYIDAFSTFKVGDIVEFDPYSKWHSKHGTKTIKAVCTQVNPVTSWRRSWRDEYPQDGFTYTFVFLTKEGKLHARNQTVWPCDVNVKKIGTFDIQNNKKLS